jgi:ABC-type phosphate/phosphonate transport system permease subunit
MNNTLNQVSGAIGTALLVTVMSNRTETHATELSADATKNMTGQPTEAALAEMQQQIAIKAMLEGINFAFFVSTFIAAVALILAFFIKRAKQAEDPIEHKFIDNKSVSTRLAEN